MGDHPTDGAASSRMAPQGQSVIPDMPNWTWYEYGMRVGFWRLMRALDKAGVTPTMSLNAKICETYKEVAPPRATPAGNSWRTAYVQMPIQQIEDQRAVMRQSIDIIKAFTGQTPRAGSGRAAARPSRRSTTRPNAASAGSPTGCSTTSRSG